MAQSTITSFFNNRKRPAADDLKGRSKLIALESDATIAGYGKEESSDISSQPTARIKLEATVVVSKDEASKQEPPKVSALSAPKLKTPARTTLQLAKRRDSKQPDMKTFLHFNAAANKSSTKDETEKVKPEPCPPVPEDSLTSVISESTPEITITPDPESGGIEKNSQVEVKSSIDTKSEVEEIVETAQTKNSHIDEVKHVNTISSTSMITTNNMVDVPCKEVDAKKMEHMNRKESSIDRARKELSLGDIRSKLTRSARLAELKASIARLDERREELKKVDEAKQNQNKSSPHLIQFNSIQLEVPASPSKSPMKSPMKSPLKTPVGSRSPSFQRYATLAQSGTPSLPLPLAYRQLAELFRCMDTVISLLFNRQELATFEKLQPAVQEMGRKNFTSNHLAQIMTVYPQAFTLRQERISKFGVPSKNEQYQLVITPVLESEKEAGQSMTPSLLLGRRRTFYENILTIVKKHHQDFLQSLDPPLVVPLDRLTRWHPYFAVDQVPEIPPAQLPESPNVQKFKSAKDVLAKARQLLACNSQKGETMDSVTAPTTTVEVVNPSTPNNPTLSPLKSISLPAALKGVPKALLEKIRAKEAARALEAMTRTSAQDKEAAQYARLPELARIVRNVFVTEKKGALQLEDVLEKVGNSYRSALPRKELEEHFRLLSKAVPGWLTFEYYLKTDYLRLCKKTDLNGVLKRLTDVASKKLGPTC